jgi:hypothetical protein
MQKMKMLRTNFCKIKGNDERNSAALKNDSLIAGHPGDRTTMIARNPKKMTVLATATQTFRALESPPPRIFGQRSPLPGGSRGSLSPPGEK